MRPKIIANALSATLYVIAFFMALPIPVGYYFGENPIDIFRSFGIPLIITAAIATKLLIYSGGGKEMLKLRVLTGEVLDKEALFAVGFGWLAAAFFASLPFVASGVLPNPLDAYFESMSGFTTTGASVITDVEIIPKSVMLWRMLTHWIGGMGIILMSTLVLSKFMGGGAMFIKSEVSGHNFMRVMPKIMQTIAVLLGVYVLFTISETMLLWYFGMTPFDALMHTMATVATGGFGTKNTSVMYYSGYVHFTAIQLVITFFMIASGVNVTLYPMMFSKRGRDAIGNAELKAYILIIATATALIAANLILANYYPGANLADIIIASLFQVSSVITTTGFATTDFALWPAFSQYILFLLMFIGGCAGSTAGAIKVVRFVILAKVTRRELIKSVHPRAIIPITLDRKVLSEDLIKSVVAFLFIYMFIFLAASMAMIAILGGGYESIAVGFSVVASAMGNIGPAFGIFGPMGNYAPLHPLGKLIFILCMWLGRLEIFAGLIVFSPSIYKK